MWLLFGDAPDPELRIFGGILSIVRFEKNGHFYSNGYKFKEEKMWEIILLFVHAQWSSISFVLKIGCLYFMLNWRLCMLLFHLIGCGFLFKSVSKTSLDCLQFCSWSLSYQYGHVSLIQREGTLLVWTENVIFICSNLFQNYYHTCLNCCLGFKVRINFRLT